MDQEKLNPYNPTKLMVAMIAIPLALLCILVPLLQYVYGESYAQTPCQGICSINETMLQGASLLLHAHVLGAARLLS